MQSEQLIKYLNSKCPLIRKWSLNKLIQHERIDSTLHPTKESSHINMNIHSNNSFAPYSPTMASYMAYKSGLKLASLCDYGTVAGQNEFKRTAKKLGISTVNGFEVTLLSEKLGECMVAFYCTDDIVSQSEFVSLMDKFRKSCFERAKQVAERINKKLKKYNIKVNFEKDVLCLSRFKKGGTLTLKHVYMATGKKIIEKYGKGVRTADFLRDSLCLDMDEISYNLLCDPNNPFYIYDLILALRNGFSNINVSINPPKTDEFFKITKNKGIIKAYQYDCASNWIKNQTESDQTIEDFKKVVEKVKEEGFEAVCLSSKNLTSSLLCEFVSILKENDLLAIFTEKTEYPRNHFETAIPPKEKPYIEACAYAILGNANCVSINKNDGLFSKKSSIKSDDFQTKVSIYSNIGKKSL